MQVRWEELSSEFTKWFADHSRPEPKKLTSFFKSTFDISFQNGLQLSIIPWSEDSRQHKEEDCVGSGGSDSPGSSWPFVTCYVSSHDIPGPRAPATSHSPESEN